MLTVGSCDGAALNVGPGVRVGTAVLGEELGSCDKEGLSDGTKEGAILSLGIGPSLGIADGTKDGRPVGAMVSVKELGDTEEVGTLLGARDGAVLRLGSIVVPPPLDATLGTTLGILLLGTSEGTTVGSSLGKALRVGLSDGTELAVGPGVTLGTAVVGVELGTSDSEGVLVGNTDGETLKVGPGTSVGIVDGCTEGMVDGPRLAVGEVGICEDDGAPLGPCVGALLVLGSMLGVMLGTSPNGCGLGF